SRGGALIVLQLDSSTTVEDVTTIMDGDPYWVEELSTSAKSVNGIQSSTLSKIRNCRQASHPAPRCAPKGLFTSSAPPRGAFFLAYFKSPSSACSPIRNGSSAKGFGALTSILSL